MDIDIRKTPGGDVVISPGNTLVFPEAGGFLGKALEAINSSERVVIDFTKTIKIDDSGARALIALYKHRDDASSRIRLINLPPYIRKQMCACGLDKVFEIS